MLHTIVRFTIVKLRCLECYEQNTHYSNMSLTRDEFWTSTPKS